MVPLRGEVHLGVLLDESREVVEETVLRSEEVELEVALFAIHQIRQESATVARDELRCQLHHISVENKVIGAQHVTEWNTAGLTSRTQRWKAGQQ